MSGLKGRKLAQFSLVPPEAIWLVAEVFGLAAEEGKYERNNWTRGGIPVSSSVDAALRHITQFNCGETLDDSGKPHLAHAIANLMMALGGMERGIAVDDRAPEGKKLRSDLLNPQDVGVAELDWDDPRAVEARQRAARG